MMSSQLQSISLSPPPNPQELAKSIESAITTTGFLLFTNHGLEDDVDKVFNLSKTFFREETQGEKDRCGITVQNKGYIRLNQEHLDLSNGADYKEVFNLGIPIEINHDGPGVPPEQTTQSSPAALSKEKQSSSSHHVDQPLPSKLQDGIEVLGTFYRKCYEVCQRLLEAFAICLDLPSDFFTSKHTWNKNNASILRLLRYPKPISSPSSGDNDKKPPRAGAHSDYGSLTLLFQSPSGSNGLQILPFPNNNNNSKQEEEWIPLAVPPSAMVVNIGDAIEFWTGGRFKSTLHRVVGPSSLPVIGRGEPVGERWSVVFFDQPDVEAELNVPDGKGNVDLTDEDIRRLEAKGAKLGEKITAGEHLNRRLKQTYGNSRKGEGGN